MMVEAVAHGGSVSFMHPLPPEVANAFWEKSLAAAARGERIILGAFDGDRLVGTVTLVLDLAPNQPHRAEIVKMMTRISHRGQGVARRCCTRPNARPSSTGAGCWCSTPPPMKALPDYTSAWDSGCPGHSRLRVQAPRRPDGHDVLLEAAAGRSAGIACPASQPRLNGASFGGTMRASRPRSVRQDNEFRASYRRLLTPRCQQN